MEGKVADVEQLGGDGGVAAVDQNQLRVDVVLRHIGVQRLPGGDSVLRGGGTGVAAQVDLVGIGADDGDLLAGKLGGAQGQGVLLVLQEDNGLLSHAQRQLLLIGGLAVLFLGQILPGMGLTRIELAQLEAHLEHGGNRLIQLALGHQAQIHSLGVVAGAAGGAVGIHAGQQGIGRGDGQRGLQIGVPVADIVIVVVDQGDRLAVAGDIAFHAPLAAGQGVDQGHAG